MLWSPVYETGVPIMDSQHQELFRQIDVLLDNPDESKVGDALDFLGKYVIQHFSTEEELQTRSKYPKYPQHRHMHEVFVDTYKKLRKQYEEGGNNPLLLMKITRTALDWLKSHIKVHDKEFAKHYTATQGGVLGAARTPPAAHDDKKPVGSLNDRLARMNEKSKDKNAAGTLSPRKPTPVRSTPARSTPVRSTTAGSTPVRTPAARTTPARTRPARSNPIGSPPARTTPSSRTPAVLSRPSAISRTPQTAKPLSARNSDDPFREAAKPAAPARTTQRSGAAARPALSGAAAPRAATPRPAPIKKDVQKQPYPTAVANLAGKLQKTDARTSRAISYASGKVDSRSGEKTPYRSTAARQSTPATPPRPVKALALGTKKPAGPAGNYTIPKRTRY